MTRIAILRHFPTDWNLEQRLQGRADRPLTDAARSDLAQLAMPVPWASARLIASPLLRAQETAGALAGDRPVVTEPALIEQSWGIWEGRRAVDLLGDAGSGFRPTHLLGWTEAPPGGESPAQAWARMQPVLARLAEVAEPAVLVMHKAVMRVLLARAHGVALSDPAVEIRRRRLYPLRLLRDGTPHEPGPPVRLERRA
jgi:probable phosphoglycerate mutase